MRRKQKKINRRKRYQKKGFAAKVMSVVNRKSEQKHWNCQSGFADVVPGTTNSYNLLHGLSQGTSTSTRIGDKIHLKNAKVSILHQNTYGVGAVGNSGYGLRVVIFRGKYDYFATNYPMTEVIEGNSGVAPSTPEVLAPLDTNQITPLFDKLYTFKGNQYSGQIVKGYINFWLPINKNFNFREDDAYGQNSNLYIAFIPDTVGTERFTKTFSVRLAYTDV